MTFQPTIRSQNDLEAVWRTLMSPLGFSGHALWMMLIGSDDRPIPQLIEITESDVPPTPDELGGFAEFLRMLRAEVVPDVRFAFLHCRPGGAGLTGQDRAWAQRLYEAGRLADAPVEVVHRACDVDLVPVPMDDALPDSA